MHFFPTNQPPGKKTRKSERQQPTTTLTNHDRLTAAPCRRRDPFRLIRPHRRRIDQGRPHELDDPFPRPFVYGAAVCFPGRLGSEDSALSLFTASRMKMMNDRRASDAYERRKTPTAETLERSEAPARRGRRIQQVLASK